VFKADDMADNLYFIL
jgi:CRP-like cAMP-binding protein